MKITEAANIFLAQKDISNFTIPKESLSGFIEAVESREAEIRLTIEIKDGKAIINKG